METKEIEAEVTYMNISTIDIIAKEWFDRTYGNSYFSAQVTVNYQLPGETTIYLPFQYGYGNHYATIAMHELFGSKLIPENNDKYMPPLWRYCDENKIILRANKIGKCLKRDVVAFGIKPE